MYNKSQTKAYEMANENFNSQVKDFLAQGYKISTKTMSGTQGEVGKIDFISPDGNEIVRLVIDECHCYGKDEMVDYYKVCDYRYKKDDYWTEKDLYGKTFWLKDEYIGAEYGVYPYEW